MNYNLIQISDCHIDDTTQAMGVNTQANLTKIVQVISKTPADKVLITGDLSQNGTQYSYVLLQKILSPISNFVVMAGNHDNANNLEKTFGNHLASKFSLGLWEIITLDSAQASKVSGFLSPTTLKKLAQNLQQSSAKYIIIALHHPIVPMRSDWDDALSLENSDELFKIIDKYPKIKAVLWGHAHQAAEFSHRNIRLISCPSTAKQFDDETRIGFNRYTLREGGTFELKTQWETFA